MNEKEKMTRRQAVAGLSAAVAAVAISPISASAAGKKPLSGPPKLEDPTKKYPKAPYKYQPQPWSGLQG